MWKIGFVPGRGSTMQREEIEHAMRNWIDGIRFAAEVLAESEQSQSQRQQMLEHIMSGAHACSGLLKQYAEQQQEHPDGVEPLAPELLAAMSSLP
jgi:hypothetical protein